MKKVTFTCAKQNDFPVYEILRMSTQLFCKGDNIRHTDIKSTVPELIKIQKNKENSIFTLPWV